MAEPGIWCYQDNFDFRQDVDASSPFHHPLEHHRGEYSRQRMLTAYHLDPAGHVRPGAKPTAPAFTYPAPLDAYLMPI